MKSKPNIILLIRSLESGGGAERQLIYLAHELSKKKNVFIITFYSASRTESYINQIKMELGTNFDFDLISLQKKGRLEFINFFIKYIKLVRKIDPDYIYAFMNAASFISILGKLFVKNPKVIFGIRASNMKLENYNYLNWLFAKAEKRLSFFADMIICNSYAGKEFIISENYKNSNIQVVHNGINTDFFKPCKEDGLVLRRKYQIPDTSKIIGTIARHDKMKGIEFFIQSALMLLEELDDICFMIVGDGDPSYTTKLKSMVPKDFEEHFFWIKKQADIILYHRTFNIFTSSSIYGEGFPNVIAESMACEKVVVATNVGDSLIILNNPRLIVDPGEPIQLLNAWKYALSLPDHDFEDLAKRSRLQITENFSIKSLAENTITKISHI